MGVSGVRVGGLGFRVWGLGLGFRVWGLGFRVGGLGLGVWGVRRLGFKDYSCVQRSLLSLVLIIILRSELQS